MKRTLSVRIEVEVQVEDESDLDLCRRTLAKRAAEAVNGFAWNPRVTLASSVLRRGRA